MPHQSEYARQLQHLEGSFRGFIKSGKSVNKISAEIQQLFSPNSSSLGGINNLLDICNTYIDSCFVSSKVQSQVKHPISNPGDKDNAETLGKAIGQVARNILGENFEVTLSTEQSTPLQQKIARLENRYKSLGLSLTTFYYTFLQDQTPHNRGIFAQLQTVAEGSPTTITFPQLPLTAKTETGHIMNTSSHRLTQLIGQFENSIPREVDLPFSRRSLEKLLRMSNEEITESITQFLEESAQQSSIDRASTLGMNLESLSAWFFHWGDTQKITGTDETKKFLTRITQWQRAFFDDFLLLDTSDAYIRSQRLLTSIGSLQPILSSYQKGYFTPFPLVLSQALNRLYSSPEFNPYVMRSAQEKIPIYTQVDGNTMADLQQDEYEASVRFYTVFEGIQRKAIPLFTSLTQVSFEEFETFHVDALLSQSANAGIFGLGEAYTLEQMLSEGALDDDPAFAHEYIQAQIDIIKQQLLDSRSKGTLYYLPTGTYNNPVHTVIQLDTESTPELSSLAKVFGEPTIDIFAGNNLANRQMFTMTLTYKQSPHPIYATILLDDSLETHIWIPQQETIPLVKSTIELLLLSIFSKTSEKKVDYSLAPKEITQQHRRTLRDEATVVTEVVPVEDRYYRYDSSSNEIQPMSGGEFRMRNATKIHRHLIPYGRLLLWKQSELDAAIARNDTQAISTLTKERDEYWHLAGQVSKKKLDEYPPAIREKLLSMTIGGERRVIQYWYQQKEIPHAPSRARRNLRARRGELGELNSIFADVFPLAA